MSDFLVVTHSGCRG